MALKSPWSRSDTIAGFAVLIAAASFVTSCVTHWLDSGVPYRVQSYIDKKQAADKIVDSVEQLISARQLAMVSVEYNIYQPYWAMRMPAEAMNRDAKKALPVTVALGNYKSAIQNGERFFKDPKTIDSLTALDDQADLAVKCFTQLASAGHKLDDQVLEHFRETISATCAGGNVPGSLDNFKNAEATAIVAMDSERAAGT